MDDCDIRYILDEQTGHVLRQPIGVSAPVALVIDIILIAVRFCLSVVVLVSTPHEINEKPLSAQHAVQVPPVGCGRVEALSHRIANEHDLHRVKGGCGHHFRNNRGQAVCPDPIPVWRQMGPVRKQCRVNATIRLQELVLQVQVDHFLGVIGQRRVDCIGLLTFGPFGLV